MSRGDAAGGQPVVELRGVAKLYGASAALKATSLTLHAGEVLALLGPNGSGKTTLLKVVAGITAPTLGTGSILGHDIRDKFALRGAVGLMAVDTYLYDDLTAEENLAFILTMAGQRSSSQEVTSMLDTVRLPPRTRVRGFSSGMKRRLTLARLLLLHPAIMLLDEPYNSLDATASGMVDEVIERAASEGRSVMLATHDVERARQVADTIAVMEGGVIAWLGPADLHGVRDAKHVG